MTFTLTFEAFVALVYYVVLAVLEFPQTDPHYMCGENGSQLARTMKWRLRSVGTKHRDVEKSSPTQGGKGQTMAVLSLCFHLSDNSIAQDPGNPDPCLGPILFRALLEPSRLWPTHCREKIMGTCPLRHVQTDRPELESQFCF